MYKLAFSHLQLQSILLYNLCCYSAGKCRFADGSKYEGHWQAGKRHGQGMCLHANGDQYKGGWQADAHHGQGLCVYASGDSYSGNGALV